MGEKKDLYKGLKDLQYRLYYSKYLQGVDI